jgi:hypothetical protein
MLQWELETSHGASHLNVIYFESVMKCIAAKYAVKIKKYWNINYLEDSEI